MELWKVRGLRPHLNLRPAQPDEAALIEDESTEAWLRSDFEQRATEFVTTELAREHVSAVRARRLPEIEKVEREVKARLNKEINYWDARAFELKEQERAGKKTRLNWQNAEQRAEDLADRLKRRMALLEQERFISSRPPRVLGGMLVIPRGLIDAAAQELDGVSKVFLLTRTHGGRSSLPPGCGHGSRAATWQQPVDVSAQRSATTSPPTTPTPQVIDSSRSKVVRMAPSPL